MQSIIDGLRRLGRGWWTRFSRAQGRRKAAWGCLPIFLVLMCCGMVQSLGQQAGIIAIQPTRTPAPTQPAAPTEVLEPTAAVVAAPAPTEAVEPRQPTPVVEPTEAAPVVKPTQPPPDAAPTVQPPTVLARANIRRQPSADVDNVVGQALEGDPITLTGKNEDGTWYQVKTASGLDGWISADLVRADPAVVNALTVAAYEPVVVPTEAPVATSNGSVVIVTVNKAAETVTLRNDSAEPVNLGPWRVLSVTGGQDHPISGVLQPGETRVFPGPAGNIWNNSESDPAQLIDPNGNVVDTYP